MHIPLVVHTWLQEVVVGEGGRQLVVEVEEVEEVVEVGVQRHSILGQQLGTEQDIHRLVQQGPAMT